MPWISQAMFGQGSTITIHVVITAHHWGHLELRACPDGRDSEQSCLDAHKLTFVQDLLYDMPADPAYPERGYLAGAESAFQMEFHLPEDVVGTEVILQVSKQT